MKLLIIKRKEITIEKGQAIGVYDYEDRKWMSAVILEIDEKLRRANIKCKDGPTYWESESELIDERSYKLH